MMKPINTLYRDILKPIKAKLKAVEEEIEKELKSDIEILSRMSEYLSRTKGKRIRPALFILCSRLLGLENDRDVVFATVIEFLHTATLVHDDIIDGADTRRGMTTVNAIWGNELTVLLGDYLYLKAVEIALTERKIEILDILAEITIKMIEGELIQLSKRGDIQTSEDVYMDIIHRKTAHLFSGCGRISSILAEAPDSMAMGIAGYCFNLGIAFQLIDDVLDFTGEGKVLGKPVANDLSEGTTTLPMIYALKKASKSEKETIQKILKEGSPSDEERKWVLAFLKKCGSLDATIATAKEYATRAVGCLDVFPPSDTKDILTGLPSFVVERSY